MKRHLLRYCSIITKITRKLLFYLLAETGHGTKRLLEQHSHVPKFGNWESEESVPYTAYFDKAQKGKSGTKMINPKNPQDDPNVLSGGTPPVQAPPLKTGSLPKAAVGVGAVRPKHERRSSREDGDLRKLTDSPARHDNVGPRVSIDSPHHRHGDRGVSSGENYKTGRRSVGSDRSIERSPLHSHHQTRIAGKSGGVSSPSKERKGSSEQSHGLAPSTHGRSRLRTAARGNETPDNGAAVPKFGDWDESNPAAADGFTHLFNIVREERQSGLANVPVMPTEVSFSNGQRRNTDDGSTRCCCFNLGRK